MRIRHILLMALALLCSLAHAAPTWYDVYTRWINHDPVAVFTNTLNEIGLTFHAATNQVIKRAEWANVSATASNAQAATWAS